MINNGNNDRQLKSSVFTRKKIIFFLLAVLIIVTIVYTLWDALSVCTCLFFIVLCVRYWVLSPFFIAYNFIFYYDFTLYSDSYINYISKEFFLQTFYSSNTQVFILILAHIIYYIINRKNK